MNLFAAWQPATRCVGGPQPGAKAFLAWALHAYAADHVRSDGIYNCRSIRGGGIMSAHAEGRAIDVGFPLVGGKANPAGDRLVAQLRPHAAQLGIGVIIWDRRIWSAKSPGAAGRRYDGVDPHTGHVHVELTRTAGAKLNLATIRHHLAAPAASGGRDLRAGDHGADVAALQGALGIHVDGQFGAGTEVAVNRLKARMGLPEDGVAGPRLRGVLHLP